MAHRSVVISVTLLLLAVIGSMFYFQKLAKTSYEQEVTAKHYDMFAHHLVQTEFNDNGLRSSISQSLYLTHYPVGHYTLFTKPHIIMPHTNSSWIVDADYGKNTSDNSATYFVGHVIITQPAMPQTPKTVITTTHGTVYSNRSLATTDAPITIDRDTLHLTGVGASVDSKNGITKLFSQVRGQYTSLKQAPYYFSSDTLIYNSKAHTLILNGHVTIDQIATHITGTHLIAYLTPNNKLISAIDSGHPATYTSFDKTKATTLNAKANMITYNPTTQFIYLDGHAAVDQNHNTISASHIIYDKTHNIIHTRHSQKEHLTHIILMPQKKTSVAH